MIPAVSQETIEGVIEQDNRTKDLSYVQKILKELETDQPHLAEYSKAAAQKIVADFIDGEEVVMEPRLKASLTIAILAYILVPIKAIYNQSEINDLNGV